LNFEYQVHVGDKLVGPQGVLGFRNVVVLTQPWHVFLALAIFMVLLFFIERSRYGLALAAIQEDETAASSVGIDTVRAKLIAFAMAAFMAAVGGGLYASYMSFI